MVLIVVLTSCCVVHFLLCRFSSFLFCFFFSSRRRHTRCALVTGVQTCALPICAVSDKSCTSVRIASYGVGSGGLLWPIGAVASVLRPSDRYFRPNRPR